MKKIKLLLLSFFTLVAYIFASSNTSNVEAATISSETTTYDQDVITWSMDEDTSNPFSIYNLNNQASIDSIDGNSNQDIINKKIFNNYFYVDNHASKNCVVDMMDNFKVLSENIDVVLERNNSDTLSILTIDDLYYYAALVNVNPYLYFSKSMDNTQNIVFYLDIDEVFVSDLNSIIDFFDLQTNIPFLVIDEIEVLTIECLGRNNGFNIIGNKGTKIALEFDIYDHGQYVNKRYGLLKVVMGYRSYFKSMSLFNCWSWNDQYHYKEAGYSGFSFYLNSSMHGKYYFYPFDVLSLSIDNSFIIIDLSSFWHNEYSNVEDPILKEMVINVKTTISYDFKSKKNEIYTIELEKYSGDINDIVSSEFVESHSKACIYSFDNLIEFSSSSSGSITIESIKWDIPSTSDATIALTGEYTSFYLDIDCNKYSFDYKKSQRIFYYTMTCHYLPFIQVFNFDLFFDKSKTQKIENVKKIECKYQMGYRYENPDTNSNGWWPNGANPDKNIKISTITIPGAIINNTSYVDADGTIRGDNLEDGFKLKYLIGVTDYESCEYTLDGKDAKDKVFSDNSGYVYNYALISLQTGSGYDWHISKIDPLAIYYETESMTLIHLVSNSQGLHVVEDDNGDYIVVDADGCVRDEYGVGKTDDGTLFVGTDLNGDGKITNNESIDADTGEIINKPYLDEKSNSELFDSLFDWFNNLKTDGKETIEKIIRIALITLSIIIVLYFLKLVLRIFKRK